KGGEVGQGQKLGRTDTGSFEFITQGSEEGLQGYVAVKAYAFVGVEFQFFPPCKCIVSMLTNHCRFVKTDCVGSD
ncbi:MAG: hypothetical protein D3909_17740, partial [Candidatus Electrothrix sp. ATG1]|nr:hypothetical protein [Candidatus Electrothrix sp. ATG1]